LQKGAKEGTTALKLVEKRIVRLNIYLDECHDDSLKDVKASLEKVRDLLLGYQKK